MWLKRASVLYGLTGDPRSGSGADAFRLTRPSNTTDYHFHEAFASACNLEHGDRKKVGDSNKKVIDFDDTKSKPRNTDSMSWSHFGAFSGVTVDGAASTTS